MSGKQIQTVGGILKKKREELSQDLADIALQLRIRKEHLEAIETNNLDALPAEAYAIGFIRTYASHLELDETQLLALFKQQSTTNGQVRLDFPDVDEKRETPVMALTLGLLGAILTAYLFVAFLSDARTVSQEKLATGKQEAALEDATIALPAVLAAPSAGTQPNETGENSRDIPADADDVLTAQSSPADAPSPEASDVIRVEPLPESIIEAEVKAAEEERPVFSIRARGETWMRVVTDGGQILFSSIIIEGEHFDFPAGEKFRLATQNAGRLEYVIDGKSVGVVGGRGQTLANRVVNVPRLLERFAARPEM